MEYGLTGFAYAIANRKALDATEGNARTLSLDLLDQLRGLEKSGQFRFTPPTHSMLAFKCCHSLLFPFAICLFKFLYYTAKP